MKRTVVVGALATTLLVSAGALGAGLTAPAHYSGSLDGEPGSALKLRIGSGVNGAAATVRSVTVGNFDVACRHGVTVPLAKAKLTGEIPVGNGGGFRERDDNGETGFKVRGRIGLPDGRAEGTFRYSGSIEDADGVARQCDSGRFAWTARARR
jgi:hypothetical protein